MYRILLIVGFVIAVAGVLFSIRQAGTKGRTLWRLPQRGVNGAVSLFLIIALGVLALTGFLPVIFTGGPVSGLILILHVTAGPVFAVCLAILAVLLAGRFRLSTAAGDDKLKWGFWLIIIFAVPLISSVVLSMFSVFGTDGQKLLLHLHGYSAVLLLLTIGITYFSSQKTGDVPNE